MTLITREDVEIRTEDGIALRATVAEPTARPRVTAVLAHAMFARRTQFDRPAPEQGWIETLARAGARAIAFDFRGHGESGTSASRGGFWSYDDLVQRDLPAVVAAARARSDDAPVVVVGHSLGGSTALASQGAGLLHADALVVLATSVWLPRFDSSIPRRAIKAAIVEGMRRTTARVGYFPARLLRQGSDDEAAPFIHDIVRIVRDDVWKSTDGAHDYVEALAHVDVPVLGFTSAADRLQCAPECAKAMLAKVPRAELRVVSERDEKGGVPDHMQLVTRSKNVRDAAVRWIVERA